MVCLSNLPELDSWYKGCDQQLLANDSLALSAFGICQLIEEMSLNTHFYSIDPILTLLRSSTQKIADFSDLKSFVAEKGLSIEEFVTSIAEQAAIENVKPFYRDLAELAELSQHLPFGFLAAWFALNTDQLERCIAECKKIKNPSVEIITLQGQAYLELGKLTEAQKTLQRATRKNPKELLAWFQLAKAFHLQNNFGMAWAALLECHGLQPSSDEIASYMAIIALAEEPIDKTKIETCWEALTSLPIYNSGNIDFILCLIDLAIASNKESRVIWITSHCDFGGFLQHQGVGKLSKVLKRFQGKAWHKASAAFLNSLDLPKSV